MNTIKEIAASLTLALTLAGCGGGGFDSHDDLDLAVVAPHIDNFAVRDLGFAV